MCIFIDLFIHLFVHWSIYLYMCVCTFHVICTWWNFPLPAREYSRSAIDIHRPPLCEDVRLASSWCLSGPAKLSAMRLWVEAQPLWGWWFWWFEVGDRNFGTSWNILNPLKLAVVCIRPQQESGKIWIMGTHLLLIISHFHPALWEVDTTGAARVGLQNCQDMLQMCSKPLHPQLCHTQVGIWSNKNWNKLH